MAALRELLAQFDFEFPHGEVQKADQGIEGLVDNFKKAQASIGGAGVAIGAVLGGVAVEVGRFAADAVGHVLSLDWVRELADEADQLSDLSQQLNISTKQLQEWSYAAKMNGATADDVTAAVARLGQSLADASSGSGGGAETFQKLGVQLKDSNGQLRSSGDVFEDVVVALAGVKNSTQQAGYASELFGKSYTRLVPLLNQGKDGLAKLRQEYRELGGGFDDEFIERSAKFNDELDRFDVVWKRVKEKIGGPALQALTWLVEKAIDGTKVFLSWGKSIGGFLGHTKLLQAALGLLGGRALLVLSSRLGGLGAAFARLGGFLAGPGRAALMAFGSFLWEVILPMLALEDVLVFLAGADSEIGAMLDAAFGDGTQEKVRAFVGELWEIEKALLTPKTWERFFNDLTFYSQQGTGVWREFVGSTADAGRVLLSMLTGGWDNFWKKLAALLDAGMFSFKVVWEDIKTIGLTAAAALSDGFDAVWNGILDGAEAMVTALADVLSKIPGGGDLAEGLRGTVASLEGNKRSGDAMETVDKDARRRQRARLAEGEDILARLQAPAPGATPAAAQAAAGRTVQLDEVKIQARVPQQPPTQNFDFKVTNNVTVPPGTDQEQANNVARSVTDGTKRAARDLRATQAALVHTAD